MIKVETYTATIYCGLKRMSTGDVISFEEVEGIIRNWVDKNDMCVSVTRTDYIYSGNEKEPGVIVGIINYPRFPKFPASPSNIKFYALELAQTLLKNCHQMQMSIVFPDETIMLSNLEEITAYKKKKDSK